MSSQVLRVLVDADDGYEGSGSVWNVSGVGGGFDYVAGATAGLGIACFSFVLTQGIPGNSRIDSAYLRLQTTTDNSGAIALDIQVENANPKTNTIPSGTHLPSGMMAVQAHSVASTAYGSNTFYFGLGDTNAINIGSSIQQLLLSYGDLPPGARINVFLEETGNNGNYASFDDFAEAGTNHGQLTIDWTPAADNQSIELLGDRGDDDFLSELRGQWLSPDLIIEKWFDEDLEPAAAGAGNDISAVGALSITGAADLDATGSLIAAGALSITGVADLDASGTLSAAGALSITGEADLDATGTLLAAGAISISGAADLDAIGQLLAAGSIVITGAADLTGAAANDISATGSLSITGLADLDAIGELLAAGSLSISGAADLTSASNNDISASGTLEIAGLANLTAFGALIASGTIVISGSADLTGTAPQAAVETFTGGFVVAFEREMRRRDLARRKRKQELEEAKELQDAIDREIAILLHKQAAEDAERMELDRLRTMVAQFADRQAEEAFSERVRIAFARAAAQQNASALMALDREIRRAMEEESFMVLMLLAGED